MRGDVEGAIDGEPRGDDGPRVALRLLAAAVMALLFFLLIVPLGVALRVLGRDKLKLRRDAAATTYWIGRDRAGSSPAGMTKQF